MVSDIGYLVGAVGTFFAILDPFGNLPFFIAYTSNLSSRVRKKTALILSVFIFLSMTLFLFSGQVVLSFFHISIPAFQIAGGIILFGVALSMMSGTHTITMNRVIHDTGKDQLLEQNESILPTIIVPLGIPLYVGPGSIAAAILFGSNAPTETAFLGGLLVILIIVLFITVLNLCSDIIGRILGNQGIEILVRLMGLVLAAIAVQLTLDGISGAITTMIIPELLHQ
ncbi:MAG: MarC family protein [Methanomicrobiales archaeon]|nr:MarC family protein [Methanomicrobiales archaeon]